MAKLLSRQVASGHMSNVTLRDELATNSGTTGNYFQMSCHDSKQNIVR